MADSCSQAILHNGAQHIGFLQKHARVCCEHKKVAAVCFHGGHSPMWGLLSRVHRQTHLHLRKLRLCQTTSEDFIIRNNVFKKRLEFLRMWEIWGDPEHGQFRKHNLLQAAAITSRDVFSINLVRSTSVFLQLSHHETQKAWLAVYCSNEQNCLTHQAL